MAKTNQNLITMHYATEADLFEIKHFLKRHKQSSAQRDDSIYMVRHQKRLIGIARLVEIFHKCEITQYWLRGLYIEASWRQQGLATQLIAFMDQHVIESKISSKCDIEIVAFPLSHLESFYLRNGYQPLEPSKLSIILQERYQKALNQQKRWLCMSKVIQTDVRLNSNS